MKVYLSVFMLAMASWLVTIGETTSCTTNGDVVFVVDRSAGQSKEELGVVKEFLKDLMTAIFDADLGDCYRTALVSFAKKPKVEYDFMSGSLDAAHGAIDGMKKPKGQGFTNKALAKAEDLFQNDNNPSEGGNKVVMLFTDGASKNKAATIEAAASLKSAVGAKVLIGKNVDPDATDEQQANRDKEISDIIANSVCGSALLYEASLGDGSLPQQSVNNAFDAITGGADCATATEFLGSGYGFCPAKIHPVPPGTPKYLCAPQLLTKFARRDFAGNVKHCIGMYWQPCFCIQDPTNPGVIVPRVPGACKCTDQVCPVVRGKDGHPCCLDQFLTKECPPSDCEGIPGETPSEPTDKPPVEPPPENPPAFSRNKFYCGEEIVQYIIRRVTNADGEPTDDYECLVQYIKRCSCILDGEGNIVPNPDADPPCHNCLTEHCRLNEKGECIDEEGIRKVSLDVCERQTSPPPVEEPPEEDPPKFSRSKLYCEEEEVYFKLVKVDDIDDVYQCIGKFTKRCACVVDENGNIVPNPDVDPPCEKCLGQFCKLDAEGNCIDDTSERRVPLAECRKRCGGKSNNDRKRRQASACSYERSCVFDGSCCDDYFDVCVSPSAGSDGFPTCYTQDEGCCTNGGCCDGVACN